MKVGTNSAELFRSAIAPLRMAPITKTKSCAVTGIQYLAKHSEESKWPILFTSWENKIIC